MKILILGGTGAMGKHVIELLDPKQFDIYVTSRRKIESKNNVSYLQGSAKDLDFIKNICSDKWDVIIDFMVYSINELKERIDLFLNSAKQYIFISSARVYADSSIITENSPRLLDVCTDEEYVNSNEYAIAKAKEENVLFDSKSKNWTIVRPSLTYAENRLQLGVYEKENWLYRALNGRSVVFSKDLMERYYTLSYGNDVASGIVSLIGKDEALGEAFHIVVDQSFQWKEILNIYLDVLEKRTGKRPNVVLTDKCTNLKLPYAKYQVIYGRYFNRHFDNTKIRKFADTSEWLLPQEGLQKCLNAFLDDPKFLDVDWCKEALLDRASREITPLKEIDGKTNKLTYLKWRFLK
ncbi:MAG: NAD-dependent epimerase/dehydratase family protein [Clostridia bacterium]|nr:NAD-dependent epimerase/dehydratase family protein [Clostridia bacterium]